MLSAAVAPARHVASAEAQRHGESMNLFDDHSNPERTRRKHRKGMFSWCRSCSQEWPCDAYVMADALETAEKRDEGRRWWY